MRSSFFLLFAALLEAGGDAIIRMGLGQDATQFRIAWIATGALVLTAYGILVNLPGWDFGRLLGAYVAVFFVTAQVINAVAFQRGPTLPVCVGGVMIVCGGLVVAFWRVQ